MYSLVMNEYFINVHSLTRYIKVELDAIQDSYETEVSEANMHQSKLLYKSNLCDVDGIQDICRDGHGYPSSGDVDLVIQSNELVGRQFKYGSLRIPQKSLNPNIIDRINVIGLWFFELQEAGVTKKVPAHSVNR